MSAILIGTVIVIILTLIALICYGFLKASQKFGADGVIFTIISLAVLIGAIVFTSYITINLGKIECEYKPEITRVNETTEENYIIQLPFHKCFFTFLGSKSDYETFFIENSQYIRK
tara:strand:- start:1919 stop:2266 length:348 start_codon:yes stop_codon:yes gene_type:complete